MKLTMLFAILAFTLSAQPDSIPMGKVVYVQEARTPGDIQNNGFATLLFNPSLSLYIQNGAPTRDSSFSSPEYTSSSVAGDKEGFPIYKLHKERTMFCKIACARLSKHHCVVRDTLGTITWTLHPDHKRFGQYDCRRATGKFRGREYDVWYAMDIPISSGPFKLGGLPGLILEAQSTDGMIKYLFSRLEISTSILGLILPPTGKVMDMTYAKFIKEELEFNENIVNEAKSKGFDIYVTRMETIELNSEN